MLTDIECAEWCQKLYDADISEFDKVFSTSGVDYAIKAFDDLTLVVFEGSHNVPDWLSNFKANMVHVSGVGDVEEGFYEGMPETLQVAMPYIPKGKSVVITAHSRGCGHGHIFARQLINEGYEPKGVIRILFASPNPGDAELAVGLKDSPCRSYRNYRSPLEQDFVCIVPDFIPVIAPYMHPGERIIIDVPGAPNDPWLILSRHHLKLYIQGIRALCNRDVQGYE